MGYFDLRTALLAVVLTLGAGQGTAQNIVLSAKDGDQTVSGTLIAFDGEFYSVETEFGPVTVDARTVTCDGADCPDIASGVARFNVMGDVGVTLPLIEAFAVFQGGEMTVSGEAEKRATLSMDSGEPLAEISVMAGSPDGLRDGSDSVWFTTEAAPDPSRAQVIGLDSVVIATSDVNPVSAITLADMRRVLRGDITNWVQLGGGDTVINLHFAEGDAGFQAQVAALDLQVSDEVTVINHARMQDLADAVANDPFGLALAPYSKLRTARAMGLRGTCGMHNQAEVFAMQAGSYPMTYALSVSTPIDPLPLVAREFLEFLETEQAQAVIADLGFADLGIGARGLNQQGQRLANSMMIIGKEVPLADVREMTAIMSGAELLSTTFRFQTGSTRLDGPSKENAEALVTDLILGNYADKVMYLMGFSDGDGRARQNKALSRERAEAVRDALVKAAPEGALEDVAFEIVGYGEASPLVCEDTAQDAAINRRVEVWVKDFVPSADAAE